MQGAVTLEGGITLRSVHVASDGTRKLFFGLQASSRARALAARLCSCSQTQLLMDSAHGPTIKTN